MTDTEQQAVPPGFRQITEGRIRTTDIIWGESGGWAVPHVFLVGTDIADDGRSIARPHVKKPGGRSWAGLAASGTGGPKARSAGACEQAPV